MLDQGSPNFLAGSYYTPVRGPDVVHNVIVSGYVTLYQINTLCVNILLFIIDKMSSRAGFGDPCARSIKD